LIKQFFQFFEIKDDDVRLYYKGYVRKKTESRVKATLAKFQNFWMVLKGTDLLFFKDRKANVKKKKRILLFL